ncbi:MAG TPA: DUF1772 domain-containing protein [Edaphobacter sp.]|nr:DUF1772 domain-containing protein [Edaphobacter sp.]
MLSFEIAAILCIGLLIGVEFAVSAFINPILWKLDESAQADAIRLFARRLGRAMPFWYSLSLLFLLAIAWIGRYQAHLSWLITSIAIWVAVILITVIVLVPINNRMMRLPAGSFTQEAHQAHKRWDTLHRLRILALGISFVCFLAAILI